MKKPLTGYVVDTLANLKEINTSSMQPLFLAELNTWVMRDDAAPSDAIDVITCPSSKYRCIPYNPSDNVRDVYALVTVTAATTVLDFKTLPRYVELELETNTKLTLLNLLTLGKYVLKINFNGYVVSNLDDILNTPSSIGGVYFSTVNNSYVILEINYLDDIKADICFEKPNLVVPNYKELTNDVLFDAKYWTNVTDSIGSSATVSGSPTTIDYLHLNNGQISYNTGTSLDIHNSDFSIGLFLAFNTANDKGTILGKWTQEEKQFWMRIDAAKTLLVSFNEGIDTVGDDETECITLEYDLTSHLSETLSVLSVLVCRTHNVYKLFIGGEMVDYVKSKTHLKPSNLPLVIGKLAAATSLGVIANTSFEGLIREIIISKEVQNNYTYTYTSPKNSYGSDVVFLTQNGTKNLINNAIGAGSTPNTEALLVLDDRLGFTLGVRTPYVINTKHHLQFDADSGYELTGDCTIEAWIKNTTGNTRGTILYHGDATNSNWHFGIYDNYLQFDIKNSAVILSGNLLVPSGVWCHVAFVREGTDNRLYVNAKYAGNVISGQNLNFYGSVPLCIKRTPAQDSTEASLNTSLYPSKSHMRVENTRITKRPLYSGIDPIMPNFRLPNLFNHR